MSKTAILLKKEPTMQDHEEELTELLSTMDEYKLRNLVSRIKEDLGVDSIIEYVRKSPDSDIEVDFDDIEESVIFAINMDDREFYSIADNDGYGNYIYPGEHAADIVKETMISEFLDDVKALIKLGKDKEVETYLKAIASGLRKSNSILAEYAGDYMEEYADNFEECLEDGRPLDGFEW